MSKNKINGNETKVDEAKSKELAIPKQILDVLEQHGKPYIIIVDTVDSIMLKKVAEGRVYLESNMKLSEQKEHLAMMYQQLVLKEQQAVRDLQMRGKDAR